MIDINTVLVKKLINEQFPQWSHLDITPVKNGGYDNRTFHLGKEMSVRLPIDEGHSPQVEKEQLWLPKLKPHISLPIPTPVAMGKPSSDYPFCWSIYNWIEGEVLTKDNISDINTLANDLANFLLELHKINTKGAPAGGDHNYKRGCHPSVMNDWFYDSLNTLDNFPEKGVDRKICIEIWETSLKSQWTNPPVWIHGDIANGNLLVKDGKLSAVIDFGIMAIGDPAVDLTISWTFFDSASRKAFFEYTGLDINTLARARAWALWKAVITCHYNGITSSDFIQAKSVLNEIINDYYM